MDFGQIIKRAWEMTRHHRFLWWLGILAAFTEGAFMRFPSAGGFGSTSKPEQTSQLTTDQVAFDQASQNAQQWLSTHGDALTVLAVALIILLIILLYCSYSAKAGLMMATKGLENDHKDRVSFKQTFHHGQRFAARLFGLQVTVGLSMLALFIVVLVPFAIAYVLGGEDRAVYAAIPFAVLLFLGLIVLALYVSIVLKFAERIVVLENHGIAAALKQGHKMVQLQLGNALLTWLVMIGVSILFGIAFLLAFVVAMVVVIGFGLFIYATIGTLGVVTYAIIAVLLLIAGSMVLGGVFTAFSSSFWTLSYLAMHYLVTQSKHQ